MLLSRAPRNRQRSLFQLGIHNLWKNTMQFSGKMRHRGLSYFLWNLEKQDDTDQRLLWSVSWKFRGKSVARATEAGDFVESKRKRITTILTRFQRVTWHLTAIFPKIDKQKDDTAIKRTAKFIRETEMSSRTISIVKRFSSLKFHVIVHPQQWNARFSVIDSSESISGRQILHVTVKIA